MCRARRTGTAIRSTRNDGRACFSRKPWNGDGRYSFYTHATLGRTLGGGTGATTIAGPSAYRPGLQRGCDRQPLHKGGLGLLIHHPFYRGHNILGARIRPKWGRGQLMRGTYSLSRSDLKWWGSRDPPPAEDSWLLEGLFPI